MSVFAKIDAQGNVLEFPYRVLDMRRMPDDAVLCNTSLKKPNNVKWYEGLWYNKVVKEGNEYVVYYTKGPKKYESVNEKKSALISLISQAKIDSEKSLSLNKITTDQHQNNLDVLNSINVDDESTYDLYHNIVL